MRGEEIDSLSTGNDENKGRPIFWRKLKSFPILHLKESVLKLSEYSYYTQTCGENKDPLFPKAVMIFLVNKGKNDELFKIRSIILQVLTQPLWESWSVFQNSPFPDSLLSLWCTIPLHRSPYFWSSISFLFKDKSVNKAFKIGGPGTVGPCLCTAPHSSLPLRSAGGRVTSVLPAFWRYICSWAGVRETSPP